MSEGEELRSVEERRRKSAGRTGPCQRIEAFNRFILLLVDENLKLELPISQQPEAIIQAIQESCNRQFPDLSQRTRAKISIYLKSCRRSRRSRELAGREASKTRNHSRLTSDFASQLLAGACEREEENKRRLGEGMEALPASRRIEVEGSPPALIKLMAQSSGESGLRAGPCTALLRAGWENGEESEMCGREERTAVLLLIEGYRESAAFLLRNLVCPECSRMMLDEGGAAFLTRSAEELAERTGHFAPTDVSYPWHSPTATPATQEQDA